MSDPSARLQGNAVATPAAQVLRAPPSVRHRQPGEFVYALIALLATVVGVQALYALHVRPEAAAILARDRALRQQDPSYVAQRSIHVLVKDYEQETEIVLMIWALCIVALKWRAQLRERRALEGTLAALPRMLQPEDARLHCLQLENLGPQERELLAPRAALAALARFGATRSTRDAATVAHAVCDSESERLESEMSLLRYIAWTIPAIGFIGTVRGIGDALAQTRRLARPDVFAVTEGLGIAFNATLMALVLSIVLMFVLHQLQLVQERLVLDAGTWLDQRVIRNLQEG